MPTSKIQAQNDQSSRPLSRVEACEYLFEKYGIKRAPSTLAKLACVGGGPLFRKNNTKVIYDVQSLNTWAESIMTLPMISTNEIAHR